MIFSTQQLIIAHLFMLQHVFLHLPDTLVAEDALLHHLVHHILDLSHMLMTQFRGIGSLFRHRIMAQEIEPKTVGHNVFSRHHGTLLLRIAVFLIDRIIGTQVLVERDAHHRVAYDDTLVQRTYLGIDARNLQSRNILRQPGETLRQILIQVVNVGILLIDTLHQGLQRAVLEENQETRVDIGVIYPTQLQHLNQRARLRGIERLHLLQGGEIA